MITSLRGKLLGSDLNSCVIEVGGIGFRVNVPSGVLGALPPAGQEVFLHTYLAIKEDALDLYGFSDPGDLQIFKSVLSVGGVGPKLALSILSTFSADQLILYLSSGDAKSLTAAAGVGLKLAQRLVLELREKVGAVGALSSGAASAVSAAVSAPKSSEAIAALVSLGYSQGEAAAAVSGLDLSLSTEDLIRLALKNLSRQG